MSTILPRLAESVDAAGNGVSRANCMSQGPCVATTVAEEIAVTHATDFFEVCAERT